MPKPIPRNISLPLADIPADRKRLRKLDRIKAALNCRSRAQALRELIDRAEIQQ